jgi:hypothetical protein
MLEAIRFFASIPTPAIAVSNRLIDPGSGTAAGLPVIVTMVGKLYPLLYVASWSKGPTNPTTVPEMQLPVQVFVIDGPERADGSLIVAEVWVQEPGAVMILRSAPGMVGRG